MTPDEPLPAAAVAALVRRLADPRWQVSGAAGGQLVGRRPGPGSEAGDTRPYVPGDDVRRMDWHATARMATAHVRDPVEEHDLETWVLLDRSASTAFGTIERPKEDLAVVAALAFGLLALRAGGRVGLVTFGRDGVQVLPPLGADRAVWHRLGRLWRSVPSDAPDGRTDLAPALARVRHLLGRRRGAVVVVSDLLLAEGWEAPLRRLAAQHDTTVVRLRDPRELELPDVGVVTLTDPETGRSLAVDTRDRRLRERFAAAAVARDRDLDAVLRRCRTPVLTLRTDDAWAGSLARQLAPTTRDRLRRTAT
jgi:uncharacterized protein (DUF58 family)